MEVSFVVARLSLKRDEIDVLLNLVTNHMMSLGDDLALHEDDGETEVAEMLRSAQVRADVIAKKLVRAKYPRG